MDLGWRQEATEVPVDPTPFLALVEGRSDDPVVMANECIGLSSLEQLGVPAVDVMGREFLELDVSERGLDWHKLLSIADDRGGGSAHPLAMREPLVQEGSEGGLLAAVLPLA